jgi:Flp pilus assembly protein TadG
VVGNLIGWLRRHPVDRDRGNIAVEFAIALPVLATLVLGIVDYGTLMYTSASLKGATRAGAEYAKAYWNNPSVSNVASGTQQQVCSALGLTLAGGSCSPVTPNVSTSCTCADNTSVTPCPPTSNPCTAKTNPGVLLYVTVAATESFTPTFSWASFAFPSSVTASTVVRTQ